MISRKYCQWESNIYYIGLSGLFNRYKNTSYPLLLIDQIILHRGSHNKITEKFQWLGKVE